MQRRGRSLADLASGFVRFPQVLINVQVAKKKAIASLPTVVDAIARVESELAGSGRVLIRYSGTEPKARIMVEGEDEAAVSRHAESLAFELQHALANI